MTMEERPHIVLVHGAYHTPWHWHLLQAELEKHKYTVSCVDLPSGGNDVPLTEDTNAVTTHFETQAQTHSSLVPLFHSYGGIPGSEALAQISSATRSKILRPIYLASFMIEKGTSLSPYNPTAPHPWAVMDAGNRLRSARPEDAVKIFYDDVEPSLAQEAARRLRPQSYACLTDKTTAQGWEGFDGTYILCLDDAAVSKDGTFSQRIVPTMEKAGVWERWRVREMEGAHSPFLSRPVELATIIREECGETV